jgi:hypothetical protein
VEFLRDEIGNGVARFGVPFLISHRPRANTRIERELPRTAAAYCPRRGSGAISGLMNAWFTGRLSYKVNPSIVKPNPPSVSTRLPSGENEANRLAAKDKSSAPD